MTDTDPDELHTGEELGDFRIVRELGRGGMATVYEAEQTSLRRKVALKVLPAAFRRHAQLRERFQREARSAAKLRHPGIVPVYAVGEERGIPFIAMELVDGRPLSIIIEDLRAGRTTPVPAAGAQRTRWAVELVIKVADALAHAHEQGILHRDVKPGNILLDNDGAPRLMDFGLALDLGGEGLTTPGDALGSPQYMSPEQALSRGRPVDQRTDVYSLAVTLYELLTLELPYPSRDLKEILGALSTGEIVALRDRDPAISPALDGALTRALNAQPQERPDNMRAFARELAAALAAPRSVRKRKLSRGRLLNTSLVVIALAFVIAQLLHSDAVQLNLKSGRHRLAAGEVSMLADGRHPGASEILLAWFKPHVEIRRVLARDRLGSYVCTVEVQLPDGLEKDIWYDAFWEVSIDGREWKPAVAPAGDFGRAPLQGSGATGRSITPELSEIFANVELTQNVSLRHRVKLALGRGEAADANLKPGATAIWEEQRTVFLYDHYPDDYPEQVHGEEVDRAMIASLTPKNVVYGGTSFMGVGKKAARLLVEFPASSGGLPAIGWLEFYEPDAKKPFASGTLVEDLGPPGGGLGSVSAFYDFTSLSPDEEARTILDLDSGKFTRVRFVFRSSRDVALSRTRFDRMWTGEVDVVVPLDHMR